MRGSLMAENKAAIRHTKFSVVLLAKSPRGVIKARQSPQNDNV